MPRRPSPQTLNRERWLVSYADFITLLFALFVVLFATGQADRTKRAQLVTSLHSAFNDASIFEGHARQRPTIEAASSPNPQSPEDLSALTRQRLELASTPELLSGAISIHDEHGSLVISLQEAGFFDSGAVDIRATARPVLDRIASALPSASIRVEGHSDDRPIHTPQFASNWDLSSARASSVARLLLAHANVQPETLSVAGYAEFHPVASNATPNGRARNRRVDIVVLPPAR